MTTLKFEELGITRNGFLVGSFDGEAYLDNDGYIEGVMLNGRSLVDGKWQDRFLDLNPVTDDLGRLIANELQVQYRANIDEAIAEDREDRRFSGSEHDANEYA